MMDTGKLNLVNAIGTSQESQTDMTPSAESRLRSGGIPERGPAGPTRVAVSLRDA